jgi:hypothetical protein
VYNGEAIPARQFCQRRHGRVDITVLVFNGQRFPALQQCVAAEGNYQRFHTLSF